MEKHLQSQYGTNQSTVSKGQKISAAIYLVTSHLADSDPLKATLRARAVELIDLPRDARAELAETITALLGTAVLARIVNEKNASIIIREVGKFSTQEDESDIAGLFTPSLPRPQTNMSFMSNTMSIKTPAPIKAIVPKSNRQDTIVSYINDKRSAAIKDIAALFPDVSEKTIQRELGTLVADGRIRKHGSKRWSLYLALTQ